MTDWFDAPAVAAVRGDVNRLIAETLDIEVAEVMPGLGLHDIPEWSSLDHVTLMVALEDRFGLPIEGVAVAELTTVAAIEEFVAAATGVDHTINCDVWRGSRSNDVFPPTPVEASTAKIHRGLDGIYIDESEVSSIDGTNGELLIRGYPIEDLAAGATFEEVAHLVVQGWRPDRDEAEAFRRRLVDAQLPPSAVIDIVEGMASLHPMVAVRTAMSMLGDGGPDAQPADAAEICSQGIDAAAKIPAILAVHHAARCGRARPSMSAGSGSAERFLDMFLDRAPRPTEIEAVDLAMRLLVDHGANASTFAAMVTAAAGNDAVGSIVSGVATMAGSRHGGAVEGSMKALREVGGPQGAADYVAAKRARREPVMGFGHRVYRAADPRTAPLRAMAERLSDEIGDHNALDTMTAVEEAMAPYQRHGLHMNVDSYLAVVYHLIGIPDDYLSAIYAMVRVFGWIAHIAEQSERNVLIRPRLAYRGPARRSWTMPP